MIPTDVAPGPPSRWPDRLPRLQRSGLAGLLLLAGHGKAESLRRVPLDLRQSGSERPPETGHPFYGAAFQVHGAWD